MRTMVVGQYGNVDNGKPLIPVSLRAVGSNEPEAGIRNPVSLGGDEVGLMNACYVAAHTDRRLFIADAGNACIRSVKLNYHTSVKLKLEQ